ncbi:MAG TPA: hypothetical protein VGM78_13360 [Ilumatobacteraceae bacterium]
MTADLVNRFRAKLDAGHFELPHLGEGASARRFFELQRIAVCDPSLARVVEAHVDAVQILREAHRPITAGAWYGVWAADDPSTELRLGERDGCWRLSGSKAFCTAAPFVDRALITVRTPDVVLLDVDIAANRHRLTIDTTDWRTPAFADTGTANVEFHDVAVAPEALVGPPGWYLDRPGFWNGACAPAACWAGSAQGLARSTIERLVTTKASAHVSVAIGTLLALSAQMDAVLAHAGTEIDLDPDNATGAALRAYSVRHNIERACVQTLDVIARISGPRPFISDESFQRRSLQIQLYVRQFHAERDLEALGDLARQSIGQWSRRDSEAPT